MFVEQNFYVVILSNKNGYENSAKILDPAQNPEMEFLDINLTKKGSNLLFHAIHSPFYWRILKKTLQLGF